MTLFRRRRSRIQRVTKRARQMRRHLPSTPGMPSFEMPSVSRPELPSLPSRPKIDVRKRVARDSGGDTPMLSLAGGLLLGLFVGVIVAVILVSRSEDDDASSARHTGITLLPHRDGEGEAASGDKSAAGAV